jgi:lipopolysaccharide transport system permease protein
MKRSTINEVWTEEISADTSLVDIRLKEVWRYRDLLRMFVKRDFVANYKQTILGPIWYFIQPVMVTITYVFIFGSVANLSTDGLPKLLFYLAGITCWNYFQECLNGTASVFKNNANIFGKVYFPRLIMPLSIVVSNIIKFSIQFLLFIGFLLYYIFNGADVYPNLYILLTPLLIILMAAIALGSGMIISSLTTKYRDLVFLMTFAVQLLMYATPVIYPLSSIPEKYKVFFLLNPLTSIVETFRYAFLGVGTFNWIYLGYSLLFAVTVMVFGTMIFNKVEKSFMDSV